MSSNLFCKQISRAISKSPILPKKMAILVTKCTELHRVPQQKYKIFLVQTENLEHCTNCTLPYNLRDFLMKNIKRYPKIECFESIFLYHDDVLHTLGMQQHKKYQIQYITTSCFN